MGQNVDVHHLVKSHCVFLGRGGVATSRAPRGQLKASAHQGHNPTDAPCKTSEGDNEATTNTLLYLDKSQQEIRSSSQIKLLLFGTR